jgi:hypothetical protein
MEAWRTGQSSRQQVDMKNHRGWIGNSAPGARNRGYGEGFGRAFRAAFIDTIEGKCTDGPTNDGNIITFIIKVC